MLLEEPMPVDDDCPGGVEEPFGGAVDEAVREVLAELGGTLPVEDTEPLLTVLEEVKNWPPGGVEDVDDWPLGGVDLVDCPAGGVDDVDDCPPGGEEDVTNWPPGGVEEVDDCPPGGVEPVDDWPPGGVEEREPVDDCPPAGGAVDEAVREVVAELGGRPPVEDTLPGLEDVTN